MFVFVNIFKPFDQGSKYSMHTVLIVVCFQMWNDYVINEVCSLGQFMHARILLMYRWEPNAEPRATCMCFIVSWCYCFIVAGFIFFLFVCVQGRDSLRCELNYCQAWVQNHKILVLS